MSFSPRPYQLDLVERCSRAFVRARAGVMQLATGGGKTATASEIIRRSLRLGNRVVFAAHLDTLIEDTHARLAAYDIDAGFVQAGRPTNPTAAVQVASLQTLHSRGERPPADLFIVDECHRAASPTVREILAAYPAAYILGLTATPQRGDGQPLDVFSWMECGPSVRELTAAGHLVPCDVITPEHPTDALISEPVDAYVREMSGQRALVFASTVEHAEWIAHGFNARGIPAAVVTGETPRAERQRLRAAVTEGATRVLVSVNVFIEGFDLPAIEGIVLARAFEVTGAFLQAIGRGLRPSSATGKERCTVIDLRGAVNLHGLPDEDRIWSLTGRPRRAEKLASLRRCAACAAIFRPASYCPRCGVVCEATARDLPRVLRREEKVGLLSDLPQNERDRRYFWSLYRVASTRMRKSPPAARGWALSQFRKKFGRDPATGVA